MYKVSRKLSAAFIGFPNEANSGYMDWVGLILGHIESTKRPVNL